VNREAKEFYHCWDMMTVTTVVGLVSLANQILEEVGLNMEEMTEAQFTDLVEEIFTRVNLFGRWTGDDSWGSDTGDEVLQFNLGE
jgi:hypothetical protein